MYHIKEDQRSIKSSEMLYEALACLIKEQEYESIRVKDVVERAQVGRATFYRNFDFIEDILRLRSDQVIENMIMYVVSYIQSNEIEHRIALLKPVLRYFYLHSEIIELLLKAHRTDIFQMAFKERLTKLSALLPNALPENYVGYRIAIRLGFMTSILFHWVETGKKEAPDELADALSQMMQNTSSIIDMVRRE